MTQSEWFNFGLALFIAMGGPVVVGNIVIAILRARGLNNAADWVTAKAPLVLAVLAKNGPKQEAIARGVDALKSSTRIEARMAGQLLAEHMPPADTVDKKDEPAGGFGAPPAAAPKAPPPTTLGGGQ